MSEKKTAKKSKSSPSKKEVTKLENALLSSVPADKVFTLETPDGICELHIKPYLSFEVKAGIMQNIEAMYFPDGVYDKNNGDMVLEFVLFQLYTGVDFGGDITKFDSFVNGNIFKQTPAFDNLYFTEEYWEIKETAWNMVDYILNSGSANYEQVMFYKNFNELFQAIKELVSTADMSLTQAMDSVKNDTGVSLPDMLAALKDANAKDEKKIVSAVLDYQAAKAKKHAEETKVPRI